jgi:hypothetical protein
VNRSTNTKDYIKTKHKNSTPYSAWGAVFI